MQVVVSEEHMWFSEPLSWVTTMLSLILVAADRPFIPFSFSESKQLRSETGGGQQPSGVKEDLKR